MAKEFDVINMKDAATLLRCSYNDVAHFLNHYQVKHFQIKATTLIDRFSFLEAFVKAMEDGVVIA